MKNTRYTPRFANRIAGSSAAIRYAVVCLLAAAAATPALALQTRISSSMSHTVFVDNGAVYGIGANNYRQTDPSVPVVKQPALSSADMLLTPKAMGVVNAKSVAAGNGRTAVLLNDGSIMFWGFVSGFGGDAKLTKPVSILPAGMVATDMALSSTLLYFVANGAAYSWNFIGAPVRISDPLQGRVKALAAADTHAIVLFEDGTVGASGVTPAALANATVNTYSAPTNPVVSKIEGVDHVVEIAAGNTDAFMRLDNGTVLGYGRNNYNLLGASNASGHATPVPAFGLTGVKKMAVDSASSFMLMADGTVKSSGWHNFIGGAVYNVSHSFTTLPGITGAKDIAASGQSVFVDLGQAGVIRGWGGNGRGQLGDGTIIERHAMTYGYFTPASASAAPLPVKGIASNPFAPVVLTSTPSAPIAKAPVLTPSVPSQPGTASTGITFSAPTPAIKVPVSTPVVTAPALVIAPAALPIVVVKTPTATLVPATPISAIIVKAPVVSTPFTPVIAPATPPTAPVVAAKPPAPTSAVIAPMTTTGSAVVAAPVVVKAPPVVSSQSTSASTESMNQCIKATDAIGAGNICKDQIAPTDRGNGSTKK